MRKSSSWFGLIALVTTACGGEFFGLEGEPSVETPDAAVQGPDAAPDLAAIARAKFDSDVAPILQVCLSCHTQGAPTPPAPGFMVPGDLYASIKASGYFSPQDTESLVLTYPTPANSSHPIKYTAAQSDLIRAWIQAEPLATAPPVEIVTPKIVPVAGLNEIDLAMLNPELAGAKLTFNLEMLSGGTTWFISQVKVKAGAAMGVKVKSPLVTWWEMPPTPDDPATPHPDPINQLVGVNVGIAANAETDIGTVVLVDVGPQAQMSVTFKELLPYTPSGNGPPVNNQACKALADFQTTARPPIQASCATAACHGNAGSSAGQSFNLSMIGSADAAIQAQTCAAVKSKLNLVTLGDSVLFRRPNPAVATHPFKFDANGLNTFVTTVSVWANKEI